MSPSYNDPVQMLVIVDFYWNNDNAVEKEQGEWYMMGSF
ncbi:hypothetical protein B8V81_1767 [Paenibacillus pasadenensis]|uniref:Uncharacterized protein n=1 Tax=Paenibacillus pasadenensis TaxID=217090 RepID=A0A2N5NB41_9BACL|nr:hypothetical protein B8V81_1767 [Paenibacillus pasadenensis]